MLTEIWRNIVGYEDSYQVSNRGSIKSLDKYVRNRYSRRLRKGGILKFKKDKYGYLQANLCKNGKLKQLAVHRVVLTAFDRPPKNNEEGNHKNGIKENNSIENLEWATRLENIRHRIDILNIKINYRGKNKLKLNQVKEIKLFLKERKLTQKQIAGRYNVSCGTISKIRLNKIWKYV
jgi:predicted XRE-type DNA-binding protein